MSDRLADIKAREQAAFGGPWEALDADENGMHAVAVDGTVLVEVGDFCDAEFIAHARDDIPHLLALVESLTAVRDAAIAWRVEANRVHAARVESLREEFGKREDSQDRIRERLSAEVDRLRATVARCERLADSWTDRGWDSPPATDWRAQLHGAVFNPVGDLRAALATTGEDQ